MTGWAFLAAISIAIARARHPWGVRDIDLLVAYDGMAFPQVTKLRGGWLVPIERFDSDHALTGANPDPPTRPLGADYSRIQTRGEQ